MGPDPEAAQRCGMRLQHARSPYGRHRTQHAVEADRCQAQRWAGDFDGLPWAEVGYRRAERPHLLRSYRTTNRGRHQSPLALG